MEFKPEHHQPLTPKPSRPWTPPPVGAQFNNLIRRFIEQPDGLFQYEGSAVDIFYCITNALKNQFNTKEERKLVLQKALEEGGEKLADILPIYALLRHLEGEPKTKAEELRQTLLSLVNDRQSQTFTVSLAPSELAQLKSSLARGRSPQAGS